MFNEKVWTVGFLAMTLVGCGGSGGESLSALGDSELRLASEVATIKPWDTAAPAAVADQSGTLLPTKTSAESEPQPEMTGPSGATSSSGAVGSYNADALPLLSGNTPDAGLWPSWRRTLGRWQWTLIPGSDLSAIIPNPRVPGALNARIDAWNGLAADVSTSRLFSAANGGHADYSGNEVYQIDLSEEAPAWTMLRAPTPEASIVASNGSLGLFHDYYLDGRPSSTHTYYSLHFLRSRDAIFKFAAASLWGTGNEANWKIDAFSLASSDWHPPGTWPEVVPGSRSGTISASICMNPVSEQVYIAAPGNLRRFEPKTGSVQVLAGWPDNSSAVYARPCAVDPIRNRVVYFGDAYRVPTGGLVYDVASQTFSRISFSGDGANEVTKGAANFAWFEPRVGKFLLKTSSSSEVFAIDPESFAVTRIATTGGAAMPDAINGVQTRWQRLPNLGGYAYYPRSGSGIWFLAIE